MTKSQVKKKVLSLVITKLLKELDEHKNLLESNCGEDIYKRIKYMNMGVHILNTQMSMNKSINNSIKKYFNNSLDKVVNDYLDLYNEYSEYSTILDKFGFRIFTLTNTSNLRRYFNEKLDKDIAKEISDKMLIIRKNYQRFIHPPINDLCKYFGIYSVKYIRHFNKLREN